MNCIVRAIATSVICAAMSGLIAACSTQELKILINQKMVAHLYNRGLKRLGRRDYQGAIADFNEVIGYQRYSKEKSQNSNILLNSIR